MILGYLKAPLSTRAPPPRRFFPGVMTVISFGHQIGLDHDANVDGSEIPIDDRAVAAVGAEAKIAPTAPAR